MGNETDKTNGTGKTSQDQTIDKPKSNITTKNTTANKMATPTKTTVVTNKTTKPGTQVKPTVTQPVRKRDDTGIYFEDSFSQSNDPNTKKQETKPADKKQNTKQDKKQKKALDLEDEYYDLEGF